MDYQSPIPEPRPVLPGRGARGAVREIVQTVLLIAALYTFINMAIPRYAVEGRSMQPSFDGEGNERVIVSRLEYLIIEPKRGDIVVLKNPNGDDFYIKRIIGLPGEHVHMENGQVFVNDQAISEPYVMELCSTSNCNNRDWVLEDDQFFVLGDNRNNSRDSVTFGPISRSLIVGRAWIRYWPPAGWSIFEHHDYQSS